MRNAIHSLTWGPLQRKKNAQAGLREVALALLLAGVIPGIPVTTHPAWGEPPPGKRAPLSSLSKQEISDLVQQGHELHSKGDRVGASKAWERVTPDLIVRSALEDLDAGLALDMLAGIYQKQGQHDKAEPMYRRSLHIREKALGPDHSDVATSLNNLAEFYLHQGQYSTAEPLIQRSLKIRERALGPVHPDVATSLNNLAVVYQGKGQSSEAELLYQRALSIWGNAPDPVRSDIIAGLSNLARLYWKQALYNKAEPLLKKALLIDEQLLGADHPDVATSLDNLALLYKDQGRYAMAEPLVQRALRIREKALGPGHVDVANSLNNLALLFQAEGQYAKAEPLYRRSLEILENIPGADNLTVATSIGNLADLYADQGLYSHAEPLIRRSLRIRERVLGPDHSGVAYGLNSLALLYWHQGQYKKAEPLFQRALLIWGKSLGFEHPLVATTLNNLAVLYEDQGRYREALSLGQRSLRIKEKALGPYHPDIAIVLNSLAGIYESQGQYREAEPLYQRSLRIQERALSPEHPDVASILNNLAHLYRAQGLYSKAETLYQRSLGIREKALGPSHSDVASSLSNLAGIYQDQGQYSKAESLYQRSLLISEKVLGLEHTDVANGLNNLAVLYRAQGQYSKAEPLYQRSLRITEKTLGPGHPDLAISLSNLAEIYRVQGYYDKAESLYQRSLLIRDKVLGPYHPKTATGLNGLASLYLNQGLYSKAEKLVQRSLLVREKVLGVAHPDVATSLNNLATLNWAQGRYGKAEAMYRRSFFIRESSLGTDHPLVAASLENLAGISQAQSHNSMSLKYLQKGESLVLQWLKEQLPFLPVQDRSIQLAELGTGWSRVFTLIPKSPLANAVAFQVRLNRQGLLQEIEQRQALLLRSSGTTREQVEQLQALTQQLASVSLPLERRSALRQQRDHLQAALYRTLPDLQIPSVSVQDVAKALPPDGALLEFQRFQPFDGKQPPGKSLGSPRYVALILRPNGTITPVQLGPAKPIDAAILQALQASAANTSDATALWGKVSQLVLQPLQPHLASTRQWFLSPDGELNRVPFAAIPSPQQPGVPVAQAVQLRQLTTGRDLLRLGQPAKAGEKPLVMANPSYDRAQMQTPAIAAAVGSTVERPQQRSSGIDATRWASLPATQLEGQQVAVLLGTQAITGPQATASALQQRQGPRVLHIATHGFFAPDQDTPPTDPLRAVQDSSRQLQGFQGEDPQLRSGLVLAGANQPDADPNDDGYLTAAEATGLQLDGTELVTLSACSTAQGAIKTGEGVYGLQRSLTVAGARSTLLSLWKVDDAATAEFMQRFYKRLKAGEGRADALQAVQQEFRSDPALKARGWDSLFYWGAWQLVGDWRPIQGL